MLMSRMLVAIYVSEGDSTDCCALVVVLEKKVVFPIQFFPLEHEILLIV
jgi:hypothetical protein